MKNVMTKAWEIAKEGAAKFGGNAKEYFAQALRMAWALIKKGVDTVETTWKTARGASIEMHTIATANGVEITGLLANGKSFENAVRSLHDGEWVIKMDDAANKHSTLIALPASVNKNVWGYESKKATPAITKNNRCKKCGSYCWGDCDAN